MEPYKPLLGLEADITNLRKYVDNKFETERYDDKLQIATQALLVDMLKDQIAALKQENYQLRTHERNTRDQITRLVSDTKVAQNERDLTIKEASIIMEENGALKRERDELRAQLASAGDQRKKLRSSYGPIKSYIGRDGDMDVQMALQTLQDSLKN